METGEAVGAGRTELPGEEAGMGKLEEGGGDRADKGNLGRSSSHVAEEGGGGGWCSEEPPVVALGGQVLEARRRWRRRPVNRLWKHPANPSVEPQARGRWGRLRASGVGSLLLGSVEEGGNPGQVCERGAVVKRPRRSPCSSQEGSSWLPSCVTPDQPFCP